MSHSTAASGRFCLPFIPVIHILGPLELAATSLPTTSCGFFVRRTLLTPKLNRPNLFDGSDGKPFPFEKSMKVLGKGGRPDPAGPRQSGQSGTAAQRSGWQASNLRLEPSRSGLRERAPALLGIFSDAHRTSFHLRRRRGLCRDRLPLDHQRDQEPGRLDCLPAGRHAGSLDLEPGGGRHYCAEVFPQGRRRQGVEEGRGKRRSVVAVALRPGREGAGQAA